MSWRARDWFQIVGVCSGILITLSATGFASAPTHGSGTNRVAKTPNADPASASAAILGVALHANNTPIPNAKVRLRSIVTGKIAAVAVASEAGRFEFRDVESASYIVELISDDGKVVAVSHRFVAGPGETVETSVRTGTKVPWFTGFFGNAAAVVSSAAALTGVTAIAPEEMQCVSPPCSIK
jgi:hypothetical protein